MDNCKIKKSTKPKFHLKIIWYEWPHVILRIRFNKTYLCILHWKILVTYFMKNVCIYLITHSCVIVVTGHISFNSFMSLSYRNQTIVLLCANQWTGFYMIRTFVMKELKLSQKLLRPLENYFFTMLKSI